MAGSLMTKEVLLEEAKRLNVDLTGLQWMQQQKAVREAQALEKAGEQISQQSLEQIVEVVPSEEVVVHIGTNVPDFMEQVRGKKLIICPEMAPTSKQLFGYEEELGNDLIVEESHLNVMDGSIPAGKDMASSTYNIIEQTERKVKAQSALPKEGCEISFRPDVDWFPVCKFNKREGYLWTHHRLPNVKDALIKSGYYEDYRRRFQDEPFIWHSGGKLLACDINLVHTIMREIEQKARDSKIQDAQREEFVSSQISR